MTKIDYILLVFLFLNDALLFYLITKFDRRFFLLFIRIMQLEKLGYADEHKKDERKGDNDNGK